MYILNVHIFSHASKSFQVLFFFSLFTFPQSSLHFAPFDSLWNREISALERITPKILILSPSSFPHRGLYLSDGWMVLVTFQSCNSLLVVKCQKAQLLGVSHHTAHVARAPYTLQQEGKTIWSVTAKANTFLLWKLSAIPWILSGKQNQHRNQLASLHAGKIELTSAAWKTGCPCFGSCKGMVGLKVNPWLWFTAGKLILSHPPEGVGQGWKCSSGRERFEAQTVMPDGDSFIPFRLISSCITNSKREFRDKNAIDFACIISGLWWLIMEGSLLEMLGCSLAGFVRGQDKAFQCLQGTKILTNLFFKSWSLLEAITGPVWMLLVSEDTVVAVASSKVYKGLCLEQQVHSSPEFKKPPESKGKKCMKLPSQ